MEMVVRVKKRVWEVVVQVLVGREGRIEIRFICKWVFLCGVECINYRNFHTRFFLFVYFLIFLGRRARTFLALFVLFTAYSTATFTMIRSRHTLTRLPLPRLTSTLVLSSTRNSNLIKQQQLEQQKRTFFGIGEILGVITNVSSSFYFYLLLIAS